MNSIGTMELTCICCPVGCMLKAEIEDGAVRSISGNGCRRGAEYARQECVAPVRVVTGTVAVDGGSLARISVKTAAAVPRSSVLSVMEAVHALRAEAPVRIGDVLCRDIAGTGVDLIATRAAERR